MGRPARPAPLALGIWGLSKAVRAHHSGQHITATTATGLVSVATLTIINGGDNLAVYPPDFRTIGTGPSAIIIIVFFAGVATYCLIGT